jgi:anthranilate/para-aminobenzoate synthase component I
MECASAKVAWSVFQQAARALPPSRIVCAIPRREELLAVTMRKPAPRTRRAAARQEIVATATAHIVPDLEFFVAHHRRGMSMPVALEIPDPGWDFAALASALPADATVYLFETAGAPPDLERRSFLAWDPECEYVLRRDRLETWRNGRCVKQKQAAQPVSQLRALLQGAGGGAIPYGHGFAGGLIGYVAYEFKNHLERLPDRVRDDLGTPELRLGLVRRVVCRDQRDGRLSLRVSLRCTADARRDWRRAQAALRAFQVEVEALAARCAPQPTPARLAVVRGVRVEPRSNLSRAAYDRMLARAHEHILDGDIYQANLSHRFDAPFDGDGIELYRRLRAINPSPFATYLRFPEHEVVSCSPERLVKLEHGRVETRPIAGTRPRGSDRASDRALQRDLLANEKERAEHLMIVDMARNDIGRVCEAGSVEVERFMRVEGYSHVRHLVSNVAGTLREGQDAFDLLAATFPGASITGVPKIRCMQIIDSLESVRRGVYTGSAGYIGFDGGMDFNILIRTFLLQGGRAYFHVGGGIVADSRAGREYEETLAKGRALHEALESVKASRPQATPRTAAASLRRTQLAVSGT